MVSLAEQTNLVQALLEEVYPQKWFAGMFYWSWTTAKQSDDASSFTVESKPAAGILKAAFSAPVPPAPPPPPCVDVSPGGGTCEQQKSWGKCRASFMTGFCCKTCWACAPGCGH